MPGVVLTVLRGDGVTTDPEVPMIRELKLPTLDHPDLHANLLDDRLPRTARAVEQALAEGDLAAADQLLDQALGCVIAGPGHERRAQGGVLVPVVLWLWCVVLVLVFVVGILKGSGS